MLEFKLNYYYEMYKDTCIHSIKIFKDNFKKKHGDFELLNELVIMIHRYQYDKYGDLIPSGKQTKTCVNRYYYSKLENARMNKRFGTKEERMYRKIMEDRKWKVL